MGISVGIIYGSSAGATQAVAEALQTALTGEWGAAVQCHDVGRLTAPRFAAFAGCDLLLLGCSTWNWGDLQDDWELALDEFKRACREGVFAGQRVALFGCGDQFGYPDTFGDALGVLAELLRDGGALLLGRTSRNDYEFESSRALEGGRLLGLLLDEDNEPEKTPDRTARWIEGLRVELALHGAVP